MKTLTTAMGSTLRFNEGVEPIASQVLYLPLTQDHFRHLQRRRPLPQGQADKHRDQDRIIVP